jgi:hypothetical protein
MTRNLVTIVPMLLVASFGAASAETLMVGAGQRYSMPSQAIAAAHDGDTIQIAPATYFDCAIIGQSHLVIEGTGPNVVLTDRACNGKALLVTNGDDITIRNLTLQRVRVPDENGAGIRAQGGNLTVENTRFINDQDGILAADNPNARIRIIGSQFANNGGCFPDGVCAHALYVSHIGALRVENSRFYGHHGGHSIKSRALKTEVLNCDIEDGPDGSSSYLIDIPNGGTTIVIGNTLQKGPKSENWGTAIPIGEEGVTQPTDELVFKNNTLTNDTGHMTTFVRNLTATPAQLSGNVFKGGKVVPLQGD